MAKFEDLVLSARSCRRFVEAERIGREGLREMVDLVRTVSCGGNRQALRYMTVSSPEACAALFPSIKWAALLKDWPGPAQGERPSGYVLICAAENTPLAQCDCGIAAQTIQLMAASRGYAACMIQSFSRANAAEAVGAAEGMEILMIVALGKPAETRRLEEVRPGASLGYYRQPDGVHVVPKRGLDEVLLAER